MEDSSASPDVATSLPMGRAPDEIGVRVHQALDGVGGNQKEQLREEVRHLLGRESAQLVEQVRAGASGLEVPTSELPFIPRFWARCGNVRGERARARISFWGRWVDLVGKR